MSSYMKPTWRDEQVNALKDGRKNRSARFQPKKGKGSYTRKPKHKETY